MDIVFSYTRKEAIEDGVLVDLNRFKVTNEHFRVSVACTSSVWEIIENAVQTPTFLCDYEGVLHDVYWMSKNYQIKSWSTGGIFEVEIAGVVHQLKVEVGPGDNHEPVLTIMLPNED